MSPARPDSATALAPASIGNIATGFDILGHTIEGPSDRVTVRRADHGDIRLIAVRGLMRELPGEANANTALRALGALRSRYGLTHGFDVEIEKGIPLGSGMGGSAASAVAAVVAANALLHTPLEMDELYVCAVEGEAAASGARHGDNVAPMLVGGVALATRDRLIPLPVSQALTCTLVHPHFVLETRRARAALAGPYAIEEFVAQSERLAQLLVGLQTGDVAAIRSGLDDVLVEPRRAPLIPGFAGVKRAALASGALGASISGGGPSVFAWFTSEDAARRAVAPMQEGFKAAGLDSDAFISPVAGPGARLVS